MIHVEHGLQRVWREVVRMRAHVLDQPWNVDAAHPEDERHRTHLAVGFAPLDIGRTRPGRHVAVTARVDGDPAEQCLAPGFVLDHDAVKGAPLHDGVAHERVQQDLDACLGQHVQSGDLVELGIVDNKLAGDGTAGRNQPIKQLSDRPTAGGVGDVEQVHHRRRARTAERAEALHQKRAGTHAPRGKGRHHTGDAAAHHQHINVAGDRNLAGRLDHPSRCVNVGGHRSLPSPRLPFWKAPIGPCRRRSYWDQ